MPWDPELFLRFKNERFAPFVDLINLIPSRSGLKVIDLGCGTGELTSKLQDHLPNSTVIGIDSSPQMLEQAEKFKRKGLNFELKKIEDVDEKFDLIFSHAAIHWVENHPSFLHKLFSMLNADGQLAVQVPSNHSHPVFSIIHEVASEEPFVSALNGWTQPENVLSIAEYADILYKEGGKDITVFEKVYPHVLEDSDALVQWTSATALVPYLDRLTEPLKQAFLNRYRSLVAERFQSKPIFFGFRRTLFSAFV
ncbi:MAG TPA: methyltransferase domain-containing protein [Acidobacteriota bacterium]|nr:methyltransferase domain-containing protein [Acidobacteriota bacterium]